MICVRKPSLKKRLYLLFKKNTGGSEDGNTGKQYGDAQMPHNE